LKSGNLEETSREIFLVIARFFKYLQLRPIIFKKETEKAASSHTTKNKVKNSRYFARQIKSNFQLLV